MAKSKQSIKLFFKKISQNVSALWRWFNITTMRDGNPMSNDKPRYTHCLNCGTELAGVYCHKCGQYASSPCPKMMEFVKEYIKNILFIERQALPTLSNLMFHPGHLVKEYCAGRFTSYLHPLKLNFFILLVMLTIFSLVGTDVKLKESFAELSHREIFISEIVLSTVQENPEYLQKIETAPRDTVKLVASHIIVDKYKNLVDIVDVISITEYEEPDTLIVAVPSLFKTDELLVEREDGHYFSYDNDMMNEEMMINEVAEAWRSLVTILLAHFPLLMFLTVPFFVISIRFIFRRRRLPRSYFYIFSLYYMAFVELFLIALFLVGLFFEFPYGFVRRFVMLVLFVYLTMALKQTFDIKSWVKSAIAAAIVNTTYTVLCFILFAILATISLIKVMM